jgi:myo-inositol 2-dehydrogenase/D-chiro-inositol 1-dehydrogenase
MALRIGIIGAGIMGADHATTLHRYVTGAGVEFVADVDLSRAEAATARIPGSRATDDALAVITDPDVDAVIVASHDSTHADLVAACVQAGKPVLCEKPLAPTLAECVRVVTAQRDAIGPDRAELISLGFMRRFDPGYVEMKAAIKTGDLGAPVVVHSIGRGVSSGPGTTSESSVTNSAIHDMDIVPWLLDAPVVEVSWHAPLASSLAAGFQDPQLMLLRTADGVLSTVEVFLNARYGYDIRCEVVCETGTLALTEPARVQRDSNLSRGIGYAKDWRPRFADAYRLEVQAWVDAIQAGIATPLATADDGLRAGAVADAVVTSMHEGGRTVAVAVPIY